MLLHYGSDLLILDVIVAGHVSQKDELVRQLHFALLESGIYTIVLTQLRCSNRDLQTPATCVDLCTYAEALVYAVRSSVIGSSKAE